MGRGVEGPLHQRMTGQARITPSAFAKVEKADPHEIIPFLAVLTGPIFSEEEKKALEIMGMVDLYDGSRLAVVKLPARNLIDLAELPSVIQVR